MRKWIFIPIVMILGVIGISITVYINAIEPVKLAEEKAFAIAEKEASLITINDFELYNGDNTYYVISGIDNAGVPLIVWVPEDKGKVVVREAKSGITKQQAIDKLRETVSPEEIVAVRLGMVKTKPAWEIYYRSKGDLINYYYVDFETGDWLRKIENL